MADSTYGLAYEEALRGVVQQQAVLTDIRGRAATMLGAAAVSTSFLGGIALQDQRPTGWSWVAVGAFVAVGLLTIWILLPRRGWTFRLSARKLIKEYVECDNPAELPEMYRDLAYILNGTSRRIRSASISFFFGCESQVFPSVRYWRSSDWGSSWVATEPSRTGCKRLPRRGVKK
jgi:hypothetical protein